MKKFLFLSIACLIMLTGKINSQVVYEQNFDSYTVGDKITEVEQGKWMHLGNDATKIASVSNAQAKSGANSLHIKRDTQTLLNFGEKTEGNYTLDFNISVNPKKFAVVVFFQDLTQTSANRGAQFIFVNNMVLVEKNGVTKQAEGVNFANNQWVNVKAEIDLDNDYSILYINNIKVLEEKWSYSEKNAGVKALTGILFHAKDENAQGQLFTSEFYIDDIKLEKTTGLEGPKNLSYVIENQNDIKLSWEAPTGATPIKYEIREDGKTLTTTTELSHTLKSHHPGTFYFDVIAEYENNEKSSPAVIEVKIDAGVERQYVIYEVMTSVHCGPCQNAAKAIDKFALDKDLKVGIIEYHFNLYGNVDPFSAAEYESRFGYYGFTGFPSMVANGNRLHSIEINKAQYSKIKEQKSPISITTTSSKLDANKYSFKINIKEELKVNTNEVKLFAVLTETNIAHQWGADMKHVNFVARKMYPDANGIVLNFNEQTSLEETIEITIPETYNSANCELVIFAQEMSTGNILQADKVAITSIPSLISSVTESSDIMIYPNPAVDVLNIESITNIDKIEIISIDGKVINAFNVNDTRVEFNTQNLNSGFYIVRIHQNNEITSRRFVVK